MTFASTFGRILSPTFQPHSQKAADTSWWLSGGIAASNCLLAYQPKGAADYAASKVNLANPGTYNAVDGAAYPTWDVANGWKFVHTSSQYLSPDAFTIATSDWSWTVIAKYSNANLTIYNPIIGNNQSYNYFYLYAKSGVSMAYAHANKIKSVGTPTSSGVMCMAGLECYKNGDNIGTIDTPTGGGDGRKIGIGCAFRTDTPLEYGSLYIQALAIYNTTLTSTQIGLLTTAMNAL